MKFKKDEIIVCNTDRFNGLTTGKEYKVNYTYSAMVIAIGDDGEDSQYHECYFDKIPLPKKGDRIECVKDFNDITIGKKYQLREDSNEQKHFFIDDVGDDRRFMRSAFKLCKAPEVYRKKGSWIECVVDYFVCITKGKKYQLTEDSTSYCHYIIDDFGNDITGSHNYFKPCEAIELSQDEKLDKIISLLEGMKQRIQVSGRK